MRATLRPLAAVLLAGTAVFAAHDGTDYGQAEAVRGKAGAGAARTLSVPELLSLGSQAGSVEELMRSLAERPDLAHYAANTVLIPHSRGAPRASVVPRYPRAVSYGRDARLLFCFTGHRGSAAFGSIETIEFRDCRFHFGSSHFADGKLVPDDPPSSNCDDCHKGHPIWDTYRGWPGVFGEIDGKFGPKLRSEWTSFRAQVTKDGDRSVYAKLPLDDIGREGGSHPPRPGDFGYAPRPTQLGGLLSRLNAERLACELKASSRYACYKFAVMAALARCPDQAAFVPPSRRGNHPATLAAILADTRTVRRAYFEDRATRLVDTQGAHVLDGGVARNNAAEPELETVARLRWLLENRREGALSMAAWSLTRETSYAFEDGLAPFSTTLGRALADADPEVRPYLALVQDAQLSAASPEGCRGLRTKAESASCP